MGCNFCPFDLKEKPAITPDNHKPRWVYGEIRRRRTSIKQSCRLQPAVKQRAKYFFEGRRAGDL